MLGHFPFELSCDDYTFIDQAAKEFEHGLNSLKTLELDAHFDKPDVTTSPVSSGSLCSVSTFVVSLNCSLLLASKLKNCGAWLGNSLCLYH